jgi:hypothetical protein
MGTSQGTSGNFGGGTYWEHDENHMEYIGNTMIQVKFNPLHYPLEKENTKN